MGEISRKTNYPMDFTGSQLGAFEDRGDVDGMLCVELVGADNDQRNEVEHCAKQYGERQRRRRHFA